MAEQARDDLDELVLTCLDRLETEGSSAIEALCGEHPSQADALRARIRSLLDAGLLAESDAPPERLGDFRLGRRLGGGGMGVVYAAVQESLGREVALKIVRSDQLYFPGARERFRREVQLVARLAHRGIVPVYTVGEENGVPYFAMERVQGATLAEVLATLDEAPRRGRDLADAVARVIEARDGGRVGVVGELYEGNGLTACVRIVQRVAEALDHAHGRGVLHRDLKPSNVMLTADGRALLFDFGLASSIDSASLTQSGSRVGSLAYMAPEQVRSDELDERTDVYGLGALLCEALTLQPPYVGGPEAVGAAILGGEPSSFARRRSDVPRDVVTIVETALAFSPDHRYASAADMARDLDHVLSRRPIEARRAGAVARAVRWTQRHPTRAALLALVVITPVLFAFQQFVAKQRVAEQSDRAERNLDHALEALDVFVWGFDLGVLEHVPHLDAERLAIFEDAVASIENLAVQRPDDVDLQARAVRLHAALGSVFFQVGRLDEAEVRFNAALELGRNAGMPDSKLIAPLNGLGNLLEKRGRLEEASDLFIEVARSAGESRDHDAMLVASVVQRNASRLQRRLGRWDEAVDAADAAIESAELALSLAGTDTQRFEASVALATALHQRAVPSAPRPDVVLTTSGDDVARAAYARSLPLLLELAADRPQRSDIVHDAAAASVNAMYYLAPVEAEAVMLEGLRLIERLQQDFPERVEYARTHVCLASNVGRVLAARGRVAEAGTWFRRACSESDRWLEGDDEDLSFLIDAGRADVNLATNLVQGETRSDACEPAARGAARLERALARLPQGSSLRYDLAWARIQEGYGRLARGEAERAHALAEAVPVASLGDALIAVGVGELLAGCAELASDPTEAERLEEEALDLLERGLELGFKAFGYLRATPEWESLRAHPRFEAMLAGEAD